MVSCVKQLKSMTILCAFVLLNQFAQPEWDAEWLIKNFVGHAKVSIEGDTLIVKTDAIPNHPTANYPNPSNPNAIKKQDLTFYIPLKPKHSKDVSATPFGPIGVAINGIPFYNQYNGQGNDAVRLEVFDSCCGHPDQFGMYHYHKYPVCIKSPFHDENKKHSPLIGFMFDGYAIYGPNGENGEPPKDLDFCNGHFDKTRGYHYHTTENYPYLVGGYHGVPDNRNFRRRN